MRRRRQISFIGRLLGRRAEGGPAASDVSASGSPDSTPGPAGKAGALQGAELEQAYRNLMLENQLLAESNTRLHDRIVKAEAGLTESPAAKRLIRTQRNALAERSRRLRELQYENLSLKREQKQMREENRKLAASLARHMQDIQPLLHREELSRRELEEAKVALREKRNELAKLTDKYYQLEARSMPRPPPSSAANS